MPKLLLIINHAVARSLRDLLPELILGLVEEQLLGAVPSKQTH